MPGPRLDARHALALAILLCAPAQPQTGSTQNAGSLPRKEAFQYIVEWRLIDAGKARLEWSTDDKAAHRGWQVKLHLESTGLVSKLYRVFDDYAADLGSGLCVEDLHLRAEEGSRRRDTVVHYDAQAGKASYLERDLLKNAVALSQEVDIPPCVHDVIGGLFYLRTMALDAGHQALVPVSDGKKTVSAKIEAQQREEIKVPAGTFKTIRYEAFLFNHVLYRRDGHLYVWLTDDRRKLPVRVQVRLRFTIGTITFQLQKVEQS